MIYKEQSNYTTQQKDAIKISMRKLDKPHTLLGGSEMQ